MDDGWDQTQARKTSSIFGKNSIIRQSTFARGKIESSDEYDDGSDTEVEEKSDSKMEKGPEKISSLHLAEKAEDSIESLLEKRKARLSNSPTRFFDRRK